MKTLFIHIPKTAGSSINKAPFIHQGSFQHKPIKFFHSSLRVDLDLKKVFKFTFVRNPYTRFASGVLNHKYATPETFNAFVVGEFLENYQNNFAAWEWVHLIPQCMFVYHGGRLAVDFVGKFENLQEDWKEICDILGESFELPHENRGEYNKGNSFYMDLYSLGAKKVIQKVYRLDFILFNYVM